LTWGIWGATVAAVAVIAAPQPWLILVAAGAAGVFIGPLYPLALSYLLELSPRGWFFAMGGMGAALFPWMTGLVSTHFHSLRYGLMVPCFTGVAMAALNWLIFRGRQTTNATHTVLS
jgi:MFS transporter, FHS family, glucose/mannose:H+ symporter